MIEALNRYESYYEQIVAWRRHLHRHPELSFQEQETAVFVASLLESWGIEVRTGIGGSGVIGLLKGGVSGPVVALRADMDALPIQDEKTCEYASQVSGVMHACGHDAHTATLLGIARALSEERASLRGSVVFIFQHAEEVTPGGALSIIGEGGLDGVDAIYGVHLWSPFPLGTVASKPGPMMAAADEFVIEVKGKGGHGGLPHQTVDSIVAASHLVVNLQTIVSRSVDPTAAGVVSVGSLHGGSSFNVIAETTMLNGTVRTFDAELRLDIKQRLEKITEATVSMFGATAQIEYKLGYPPVVNDAREAQRYFEVGAEIVGAENTLLSPYIMAGEDFAYYLHHVPGCFIFVGAGNVEQGIVHPHHHPKFDIDERAMLIAGKLLIGMTLNRLNEQK